MNFNFSVLFLKIRKKNYTKKETSFIYIFIIVIVVSSIKFIFDRLFLSPCI